MMEKTLHNTYQVNKPITKGFTNYTALFQFNIKQYFNYLSKTQNTDRHEEISDKPKYKHTLSLFFAERDSENCGFPLRTKCGLELAGVEQSSS